MCEWLNLCGRNSITLNPEKLIFVQDTVKIAGFKITTNCVRPCKRFLQAIMDFPIPRNITDIQSWFGLVNQVAYAFSMTEKMLSFRDLLKPHTPFWWDDQLNESRPICLATDWSKVGIGFWLFQKHCNCSGRLLFFCPTGWRIDISHLSAVALHMLPNPAMPP